MTRRSKARNYMGPRRATAFEKESRAEGTLKVPSAWKEGTNTRCVYPGQCFWRSFQYAVDPARESVPGVWLVHGESDFSDGSHAWVELPDGLVFDAVLQRWYPDYYGAAGQNGKAWYKYTPDAAWLIYNELNDDDSSETVGFRFDRFLWLPWGDSKNPLLIDYERATRLIESREKRKSLFRRRVTMTREGFESTLRETPIGTLEPMSNVAASERSGNT